ncbi:MAG: hypothetical protein CMP91_12120 [Gammaproteobacteria bacterium]|nr:hypothetical protein [Gammaproteobacteria bacterium]|tara:strand:- start:191602 stop:193203 length:1602 start_codon:yes stop_codon:yes gene_type:complete
MFKMKRLSASILVLALAGSGPALAQVDYSLAELETALQQGMDVNWSEADGTTLLMHAIYNQESDKARLLIQQGADVNASNRYGATALYLAAQQGMDDIAIMLLAAGANTQVTTPDGETLLMTASAAGSARIVRALLADDMENMMLGLDPNQTEAWKGQTALMWAAARGHVEVMEALIEAGADPDMRSANVKLPERDDIRAQGGFVYPDIPPGRLSALHFAAREGQLEAVQTLIDAGADLDIVDEKGSNALVLAALNGHFDVAGALLEAGADPNIQDEYGRSVVFVATDINTLDANPRPGPRIVSTLKGPDIVAMALERGADPNLQLKDSLPSWLSQGAGHNRLLDEGATAFFRAAMSADLEIMNLLLEAGADPNLGPGVVESEMYFGTRRGGTTPFMAAAGIGWRENISRGRESDAVTALDMLLSNYNVDINDTNQSGETALHGAAHRGSLAITEFLLDNGADITALTEDGGSILDIANGNPDFTNRAAPKPEVVALLESRMTPADYETIEAGKARIEAEKAAEEAEEESSED